MPVSVELNFPVAQEPGAAKLAIFEASASSGPWTLIETVTAVGTYPDYISRYRTAFAASATDWFTVQWLDAQNAPLAPAYPPMKGGAASFVQTIVERVRQRDVTLDEDVVTQEAEGAIERYFNKNPYDVSLADLTPGRTYRTLNGLTYLVMARAMLNRFMRLTNVTSATIGMVSMKSGSTTSTVADVEKILQLANQELGLNFSVVMLMEEISIGNSISSWQWDESRLMLSVGLQ